MQCCLVTVYQRIAGRYPDLCEPEDYLFFPQYVNRSSAKRIIQRQFNELLKTCNLNQMIENAKEMRGRATEMAEIFALEGWTI